MMTAQEAISSLDPEAWGRVPPVERLHLLELVRENMKQMQDELAAADQAMKNGLIGADRVARVESATTAIVPVANMIAGCIALYEDIVHGKMPEPLETREHDGFTDLKMWPRTAVERAMNMGTEGWLRVRGKPVQVNPYDRNPGIIGVLGAGNFSSAIEMVKGLFVANCAVVHKPHHQNAETDKVWARIWAPLVEIGALAFAAGDQSRALTSDDRVDTLYFTGGVSTAKAIEQASSATLVSELGGNNPCVVVPGDRPWTEAELAHQAIEIVTLGKLNGGAVCGRVQTIVTSKQWAQRDAFLDALRKAITEDTPADSSYYPGSQEVAQGFVDAYPNHAEVLKPEGGKHPRSDFVFIPDAGVQSYATQNEAFCQVLSEVALDVPADADTFLAAATRFCNDTLLGSLAAMVIIDEDTKAAHADALDRALVDLRYGAIAVNNIPPQSWWNPWLNWGGNEEGRELESGRGNFGNVGCFENVEKAILTSHFMSMGHMMHTHKHDFESLMTGMVRFSLAPSWLNLARLMGGQLTGAFHSKDF